MALWRVARRVIPRMTDSENIFNRDAGNGMAEQYWHTEGNEFNAQSAQPREKHSPSATVREPDGDAANEQENTSNAVEVVFLSRNDSVKVGDRDRPGRFHRRLADELGCILTKLNGDDLSNPG